MAGLAYPVRGRDPGCDSCSVGRDCCHVVQQQEGERPSGDQDDDRATIFGIGAE